MKDFRNWDMATMHPVLFDFKFVEGPVLLGFNGLLSETELQKVKGDHPEKTPQRRPRLS